MLFVVTLATVVYTGRTNILCNNCPYTHREPSKSEKDKNVDDPGPNYDIPEDASGNLGDYDHPDPGVTTEDPDRSGSNCFSNEDTVEFKRPGEEEKQPAESEGNDNQNGPRSVRRRRAIIE